MKVHYPKLYNMAHLSLNVFTASKGSNNYILSTVYLVCKLVSWLYLCGGNAVDYIGIQLKRKYFHLY